MGPTRPLALLASVALVAVAGSARAADYLDPGPVVVPQSDPGPVNATSTGSTVTFAGNPYAPLGAINASGALGVAFAGPTTADTIGITTTNAPVSAPGGLAARAGAITINAGTGDATIGGLAVATEAVSGQITATNLALSGTISVPVGGALAVAPFGVAATTTTGTVAVAITGVPATPLVAGSRIKVFAWTGVTHAITVSAVTGPALGPNLKYSAADVPVGGDVVVIAACGDLVIDPGEQCDDGNVLPGDGCSATCTLEPDAGADAGGAGDAGRDAGSDADADVVTPDAGGPDGSLGDGPITGGPPLGDIFYDDDASCAFAPATAAGGFPAAALAILALLGRRRRQFR